jgi:hypothetical protein
VSQSPNTPPTLATIAASTSEAPCSGSGEQGRSVLKARQELDRSFLAPEVYPRAETSRWRSLHGDADNVTKARKAISWRSVHCSGPHTRGRGAAMPALGKWHGLEVASPQGQVVPAGGTGAGLGNSRAGRRVPPVCRRPLSTAPDASILVSSEPCTECACGSLSEGVARQVSPDLLHVLSRQHSPSHDSAAAGVPTGRAGLGGAGRRRRRGGWRGTSPPTAAAGGVVHGTRGRECRCLEWLTWLVAGFGLCVAAAELCGLTGGHRWWGRLYIVVTGVLPRAGGPPPPPPPGPLKPAFKTGLQPTFENVCLSVYVGGSIPTGDTRNMIGEGISRHSGARRWA